MRLDLSRLALSGAVAVEQWEWEHREQDGAMVDLMAVVVAELVPRWVEEEL
jgi:hypothetical protein